ncbi:mechanosensitive ion channel family protein [Candidatus Vampirococcus lugosii]|uniref:Mechanosensitive ion channel protein MscS n=1 Tax=Candidatus Vampirococcus lugosii TaxID=2789015 RepID=A0ABS5QKK4_9BACT|nr:mechanosensitive ion channel family protein [Candidatus Vampirococcus lugosii]MBS8121760.1 mechanosensitive ion channel protein MscS [Candidatus Vampirococcus lugosii]
MIGDYLNLENISNLLSLNTVFFGNTVLDYLLTIIIFVVTFFVIRIFKRIVLKKLDNYASKTNTDFDEFFINNIKELPTYFFWTIYLYIPLKTLTLSDNINYILNSIILFVLIFELTKILVKFVRYFLSKFLLSKDDNNENVTTFNLLLLIGKVVIWATALLFFLMNLGFEITPLLASLGVGGIAVAFALQNVLEDIFSSISIYLDKPFKIGDFIAVGGNFGTVNKVGIKSTRLKTLQGEELVISNKELTNSVINNYGNMQTRRIVFSIGVVYETPLEKLKIIPKIVEDIFLGEDLVDAELQRVHFSSFGDFSLNYEIVYTMQISDYNRYMDAQQYINFELVDRFKKELIEFAYPTQVIYSKK